MYSQAGTLGEFKRLCRTHDIAVVAESEKIHGDGVVSIDTRASATYLAVAMRGAGHRISSGRCWNVWRTLILT